MLAAVLLQQGCSQCRAEQLDIGCATATEQQRPGSDVADCVAWCCELGCVENSRLWAGSREVVALQPMRAGGQRIVPRNKVCCVHAVPCLSRADKPRVSGGCGARPRCWLPLVMLARSTCSNGAVLLHCRMPSAAAALQQVHGCSVLFTTDSIHISRLPRHLTRPQQQLAVFADQLGPHSPAAAAACLEALGEGNAAAAASAAAAAAAAASPGLAASAAAGSSRYWNHGGSSSGLSGSRRACSSPQQLQEGSSSSSGGDNSATAAGSHAVWMSACYTFRLPDASRKHWLQQQLLPHTSSDQHRQQSTASRGGSYAGDAVAGFRAAQGLGFGNQGLNPADDDDEDDVEWDADAPWHPWAQHRDPIKALELDVVWQDRQLLQAAEQHGPTAAAGAAEQGFPSCAGSTSGAGRDLPQQAAAGGAAVPLPVSTAGMQQLLGDAAGGDHWLLHVAQHGFSSSPLRQGRLGMRSADRHRRHVSVAAAGADWLWNAELAAAVLQEGGRLSGVCPQPYSYNPGSSSSSRGAALDPGSFTTMLSALMTARTAAAAAGSLYELAGVARPLRACVRPRQLVCVLSSSPLPPEMFSVWQGAMSSRMSGT
ncbi:hypothetical protein COO60DRAFT_88310 [Scenedesmus sp. NREL 46B-D3]|nr:hypothetical protein COO60DRAFT_88310 [Scenedesmus sp. NREL 46B-D3]